MKIVYNSNGDILLSVENSVSLDDLPYYRNNDDLVSIDNLGDDYQILQCEKPNDYVSSEYIVVNNLLEKRPVDVVVVDPDEYKRLREFAYPPMADYIDGIVKGDEAQVQAYIDACLAVKAKYPKPN
jgi:hypothetical protein